MMVFERYANIECKVCDYKEKKKIDLSEYRTGKMFSWCPNCEAFIESLIIGIEKK